MQLAIRTRANESMGTRADIHDKSLDEDPKWVVRTRKSLVSCSDQTLKGGNGSVTAVPTFPHPSLKRRKVETVVLVARSVSSPHAASYIAMNIGRDSTQYICHI